MDKVWHPDWHQKRLVHYGHIMSINIQKLFIFVHLPLVQLNKYQTDLYFLELCHQMMNDCLLIFGFLPVFVCWEHKIVLHIYMSKQKQFFAPVLQTFSNLGKFSDIIKKFHVKSWLTYQSYSSVWQILSCKMSILIVEEFLEQILDLQFEMILPEPSTVLYENMQQKTDKYEDY